MFANEGRFRVKCALSINKWLCQKGLIYTPLKIKWELGVAYIILFCGEKTIYSFTLHIHFAIMKRVTVYADALMQ